MTWLERFKLRWDKRVRGATPSAGRVLDAGQLLREVVTKLSGLHVEPADFFDRPELVELIEAAKHTRPAPVTPPAAG